MKYYWILYMTHEDYVIDVHPFTLKQGLLNWKEITVEEYNLWQELHNEEYGIYIAGVDPYPHSEHTMD